MDDQPFTVCPGCDKRIDPDEPDAIYAVEMRRVDAFGKREYVEGMGAFFHPDCFPPWASRYRVKPKP